jgi:hypothetical protein
MTSNFTKKLTIVAMVPLLMVFVSPNIISESFAIDMVTCTDGDVLVKKTQTGNHACLHESSANVVVARGWGTIVQSNDNVTVEEGEEIAGPGSLLALSRANVPATIPMHQGFYNGESVHFIITDSSDPTHAEIITENQGWQVELAPLLANTPEAALSKTYMFTNGVEGDGVHGFQGEVFTSTPAQPDIYSALTSHVHVTWNDEASSRVLDSEEMVMTAADAGEITLADVPVVLNMPQIVWPEGQMMVKEDKTLADDTPYGGGQVLDIDTEEKLMLLQAVPLE